MPAQTTTSVKLDPALKKRVQKLALSRRRSAHWILCEAVKEYVAREESREQLKRDALSAWADYQETGLHATAKDVDAWLAKLETGKKARAPKCRV